MPELDGTKYTYTKKGYKKYLKALMKKRKKKKMKVEEYGDPENQQGTT